MKISKCLGGGGEQPNLFSSPSAKRCVTFWESNGVMNREFTEVHTVRASAPFSALHEGFVSRFVLWKFRPPYTRTDSEIAAPACIFAYMEKKKKENGKKSGMETGGGGGGVGRKWCYMGRKLLRTTQNSSSWEYCKSVWYKIRHTYSSD